MIRSIAFGIVCLALFIGGGRTQEKKEDGKKGSIEWKLDYLDTTFGIKLKSATFADKDKEFKLLLEFTKDVENPNDMRVAFLAPKGKSIQPKLWFHFFDGDNVKLFKNHLDRTEGELSGKKGEAFRVYIKIAAIENKIKKVEVRPAE
jgi:hypothetical protein